MSLLASVADSIKLRKTGPYCLQLSLQELRDAVVKIYENRKNLAATLTDTKNVVANLERVMTAVVQFVLFFAYLAIWKVGCPAHTKVSCMC